MVVSVKLQSDSWHCPSCDYDLRGGAVPGTCPECGLFVTSELLNRLLCWERNKWLSIRCVAFLAWKLAVNPAAVAQQVAGRPNRTFFHAVRFNAACLGFMIIGTLLAAWLRCALGSWQSGLGWGGWRWSNIRYYVPSLHLVCHHALHGFFPVLALWFSMASTLAIVSARTKKELSWHSGLALVAPFCVICAWIVAFALATRFFCPPGLWFLLPYAKLALTYGIIGLSVRVVLSVNRYLKRGEEKAEVSS